MAPIKDDAKLLSWMKYVLILPGFWTEPVGAHYVTQNIYKLYSIFIRSSCFIYWFLLVADFVRLMILKYDVVLIMESLSIMLNATKFTIKMVIYWRTKTFQMIKDIAANEEKVWASGDDEIFSLYHRHVALLKKYIVALITPTTIGVCLLQGVGAVQYLKLRNHNILFNETVESHTMCRALFPLNRQDHPVILLASEVLWGFLAITFNGSTHLLFATLLVYCRIQLRILQIRFRKVFRDDKDEASLRLEGEGNIEALKQLIKDHQYIISFVTDLNGHVKYIIMIEFILSSLDLASVHVAIVDGDAKDYGWLAIFMILLGVQLYLLSWNSNEIKLQSEAIGNAMFESKWYLLPKEGTQMVQIVIARSQKPLEMTIGSFGPMTTSSMVLKTAYSYTTLMQSN